MSRDRNTPQRASEQAAPSEGGDKQRSPQYPQISLPEAIDRIRTLYNGLHTARASQRRILELLGFKGPSGTTQGIISALKKYGLLEGKKDSFNVSRDAVMILERQADHPEYIGAIARAAFAPTLFSEIRDHLGGNQFSDEDLRVYLVTRGFSRRAVDQAIHAYRDTMALVSELPGGNNAADVRNSAPLAEPKRGHRYGPTVQLHRMMGSQIPSDEELHYRIAEDCKARVLFDGNVTQEAIKKLIAHLELSIDDFPKREST